ncbi:AAA family ATPase [Candidatus Haliotispira prima]|uniref:AAA family ATPase n=1 Tax=Candidatus Haliotispira prima TaxID=3034016 RepID=A0ABY8MHS0_9SPIO|nr:AAA family ATPase [Candidatus Haliotispira prima]
MTIKFQNLGPLRKGKFKLNDFTVICGPNNSGKTYLAYLIYGTLENISSGSSFLSYHLGKTIPRLRRLKENETYIEFPEHLINDLIEAYFSKIGIDKLFNTESEKFLENLTFCIADWKRYLRVRLEKNRDVILPLYDKADRKYYRVNKKKLAGQFMDVPEEMPPIDLLPAYIHRLLSVAFPKPHLLTGERHAVPLFYKEFGAGRYEVPTKPKKLAKGVKRSNSSPVQATPVQELPEEREASFSLPIGDNVRYVQGLPEKESKEGKLWQEHKAGILRNFSRISPAEYKWDSRKEQFDYQISPVDKIPLHAASSMARELADLYFYLRHDAAPGQLLMIDEPESHLTPRNQMLMVELLAYLSNIGLKVCITTHSDFIVRELNNLIMARELGKQNRQQSIYLDENCLSKEKISAYVTKEIKSRSKAPLFELEEVRPGTYGLAFDLFDDAIEEQGQNTNALYEQLECTSGGSKKKS